MGLGICEEKVFNIFYSKDNLETALERAVEGGTLQKLEKEISRELVRVYQIIAGTFEERGEFDESLKFFSKCLEAAQRAENLDQEAECYQKIGNIHEKLGDLE